MCLSAAKAARQLCLSSTPSSSSAIWRGEKGSVSTSSVKQILAKKKKEERVKSRGELVQGRGGILINAK